MKDGKNVVNWKWSFQRRHWFTLVKNTFFPNGRILFLRVVEPSVCTRVPAKIIIFPYGWHNRTWKSDFRVQVLTWSARKNKNLKKNQNPSTPMAIATADPAIAWPVEADPAAVGRSRSSSLPTTHARARRHPPLPCAPPSATRHSRSNRGRPSQGRAHRSSARGSQAVRRSL
jgi:hypothetical protein